MGLSGLHSDVVHTGFYFPSQVRGKPFSSEQATGARRGLRRGESLKELKSAKEEGISREV